LNDVSEVAMTCMNLTSTNTLAVSNTLMKLGSCSFYTLYGITDVYNGSGAHPMTPELSNGVRPAAAKS